jgi:hypothetical protein
MLELEIKKNPERAPNFGKTYGQNVEPEGTYVTKNGGFVPEGWFEGKAFLNNPLFIDIDDNSLVKWKNELADKMKAKGKRLTEKLMTKGYDAIITKYSDGDYGEIILFPNAKFYLNQKEMKESRINSLIESYNLLLEEEGDWGYHAGNLAHKSGTLSLNSFQKTLKSQLGTGYYFFGNLDDALTLTGVKKRNKKEADTLKGTTVYRADFSKYNLFKPRNASEFYDNLIIPTIKFLNQLSVEDIKDEENVEGLLEVADYYREMGVNIDDKKFMQIVKEYLHDMDTKTSITDELLNSRILKYVGFEGVDLRNTEKDGIVNGRAGVGSVLFDLKSGTYEPIDFSNNTSDEEDTSNENVLK